MFHILTDLGYDIYLSDTATPPTDAGPLAAWNRADRKALSTIILRVDDNVLVYVSAAKTAKEAWTALSNMYEAKGAIGITLTRRKFHRSTCPEDGDIEEHIRTMRTYSTELSRLGRPIPDDEFAYTLLESLPESWDSFVSAIADDVAADSTKLIARILAEDARRRARTASDPTTALPAVDMSKVKCFKCGNFGHYASKHDQQRNTQQQNSREQSANNSNQSSSSRPPSKFHRRGRQGKGKSRAHVAVEDSSGDKDFGFIAREPATLDLRPDDWLLDSACSRTIVRNKSNFTTYSETPGHKIVGIGDSAGIGRGTVPLSFAVGKKSRACMMRDVLHCPTAPFNLVSLGRLTDAGFHAVFDGNTVEVRFNRTGTLLAIGDKVSRLYKLRIASTTPSSVTHAFPARTWDEWHRALGHLNYADIRKLKAKNSQRP